jgi:hypothetical protein
VGIALAVAGLVAIAAFGAIQALTTADAEKIALDLYPDATVLGTQRDDEKGSSVYSVELQTDTGEVEVNIDPNSGEILSTDAADAHEDAGEGSESVDVADDDQVENEQEGDYEHED